MKMSLIFLISFAVLSGCASVPANTWTDLDTETSPAATLLDCGSFPLPDTSSPAGMTYSKVGANKLNAYRLCSEDNEAIGIELSAQVDQLKIARKGLTEAGRAQRNIADMKQEMLDDERKHNFFTSIGYWILIIGMGVAL